jgi:hypothetical protein
MIPDMSTRWYSYALSYYGPLRGVRDRVRTR